MGDRQARLEEARQRALIITERIQERADEGIRQIIRTYSAPLDFEYRLEDLAIASEAWAYIVQGQIEPKLVFAHPDLLQAHPRSLNFAVLGVVTPEMRRRLDEMNVARDFLLYQILNDQQAWDDFIKELFHHTLRII